MEVLVVKLGAAGDVVRTTVLLRSLKDEMTWLVNDDNSTLLRGEVSEKFRYLSWERRDLCRDRKYDLVINLEDTLEVARYLVTIDYLRSWGAQLGAGNAVVYTEDAYCWFDLSMISRFGRRRADALKLANRATYQELIFQGLGLQFSGETYLLPATPPSQLRGDVAIAAEAGPVWPMKKWAYYHELGQKLEAAGLVVNVLPRRSSLLEHLADVRGHRCLVSGDSLPMHFALGSGVPCVSIFTCTSPWEIHDYGLQKKIISPLLAEFFYQRGFDPRATTAVSVEEVFSAVMEQLQASRMNSSNAAGELLLDTESVGRRSLSSDI